MCRRATKLLRDDFAVLIRIAQLSKKPCAVVLSEKLKPVQARVSQTEEFDFGLPSVAPKLRVDYVRPSQTSQ